MTATFTAIARIVRRDPSADVLTPLLITLSAIALDSTPRPPVTLTGGPDRRDGALSARARSDPAAPPGVPRPEGCPGSRRLARGRQAPDRARPRRALRLQSHHDPAGARGARPRGSARADARSRHIRAAAPDRRRFLRVAQLHAGDGAPG